MSTNNHKNSTNNNRIKTSHDKTRYLVELYYKNIKYTKHINKQTFGLTKFLSSFFFKEWCLALSLRIVLWLIFSFSLNIPLRLFLGLKLNVRLRGDNLLATAPAEFSVFERVVVVVAEEIILLRRIHGTSLKVLFGVNLLSPRKGKVSCDINCDKLSLFRKKWTKDSEKY